MSVRENFYGGATLQDTIDFTPRVCLFMEGQSNDVSRYVSKYKEGIFQDMFNGYICSSVVAFVESVFVVLSV